MHYWCKGYAIAADMYKGYLNRFHRTECDKNILRWSIKGDPISGIVRTPWEEYKKRDPRYNLSPPIVIANKDYE